MPTPPTHALAAIAIGTAFPESSVPRKLWLLGAAGAMLPDVDVLGFRMGIRYGDFWGHRGFTHSLAFAAGLAVLMVAFDRGSGATAGKRVVRWLYLFLAVASHGVLDAFTDGGLGIALLAPFDNTRYFFPVRPIAVSPIGLGAFFTARSLPVIQCELLWVWLPCLVAIGVFRSLYGRSAATSRGRSEA